MNLIVAVDKNWGIGYQNKLLVSIPEDMKFFRSETTGKVVVMGRKTLESFPGGRPLKNRTNIVLTRNPHYQVKDALVFHTVEDVLADPNLEGCAAVENGNVIQIPGDAEAWDSPVPGGILGAVWLSSELHPEECPQADSEAVIHEFYETFYGFSYGEN